MIQSLRTLCLVVLIFLAPLGASAQEKLHVAVAANFIQAFQTLSAGFEQKTGVKVEATYASTGSLYAQIANGAPYDLFLSADEDRPARLHRDGLAEKPFVYAKGQSVLWSPRRDFCRGNVWQEAVKDAGVKKIALANPETAPYGTAARTALQKAGLWESLQKKWVFGQDIAQAYHYASTEAVDAGFCALSSVLSDQGKKGCYYTVAEAPEIIQSGCVLKRTINLANAELLAAFLMSADAMAVKTRLGYR